MSDSRNYCADCPNELPPDSPASRRYCSTRCRKRAEMRRYRRSERETELARLQRILNESRMKSRDLESRWANARKAIEAERTQLRRQEVKARKRERQQQAHAQRAITARVKKLVATRDRLASVTADLVAATTGHADWSDLEIAAQQIVDLEKRVATATDRHRALSGQYSELHEKFESLVTDYNKAVRRVNEMSRDRQKLRPVIDAWDTLAGRLANSVPTGQLSPGDREIVRSWATWKAGRDRILKAGQ